MTLLQSRSWVSFVPSGRSHRRPWRLALLFALALPVPVPVALAGDACSDLLGLDAGHVAVLSAEPVDSGEVREPRGEAGMVAHVQLPRFCRVKGVSAPVPGSRIGFEVWLPLEGWTERLHMVGNGGYSSRIYYAQMAARIRARDVAVATDTGHEGGDLTFAVGHPERIVDWAQRAVHESVQAAKQITAAFYGQAPRHAYFSGCSTGGHQALSQAQRYPEDFDGIIAGAPGNHRSHLNLSFLWTFLRNHEPGRNDRRILDIDALRLLNRSVLAACDRLDGVADGVINHPPACRFDVRSLACRVGQSTDCLSPAQVDAALAIYAGPRDERSGKSLYAGYPFGSEGALNPGNPQMPGWSSYWEDPQNSARPSRVDFFRHWVFNDPDWDWWDFDWGDDVDAVHRQIGGIVNATNPDLSAFRARGGKLILFMGWDDPVGAAPEIIDYYQQVENLGEGETLMQRRTHTQQAVRLFMVPGMGHCAGGSGATNFSSATRDSMPPVSDARHDMAIALQEWVEQGVAPETIMATRYADDGTPTSSYGRPSSLPREVAFQRPLCVYPKIARYTGGDSDAADSFQCVETEMENGK